MLPSYLPGTRPNVHAVSAAPCLHPRTTHSRSTPPAAASAPSARSCTRPLPAPLPPNNGANPEETGIYNCLPNTHTCLFCLPPTLPLPPSCEAAPSPACLPDWLTDRGRLRPLHRPLPSSPPTWSCPRPPQPPAPDSPGCLPPLSSAPVATLSETKCIANDNYLEAIFPIS